jgi:hypothetical protein
VNQFKSATLTILIGCPWRTVLWGKHEAFPLNVRNDVHCVLNLLMPGWHHLKILDKPVRNYSLPQFYVSQHTVTVEVFYRSFELKRSRMLDQYPRLCRDYEPALMRAS